MKHKKIFLLLIAVTTSLQLTASVGGGLAGAAGAAMEAYNQKELDLEEQAARLNPRTLLYSSFDAAIEQKNARAIRWLSLLVPQKYKNEKISQLALYGYKNGSIGSSNYWPEKQAQCFLSDIIRQEGPTDLDDLRFYATLFACALPNKRSKPCPGSDTDDSELPVLRQLLTTAAEHAKPEAIALLVDEFGASVNVVHHHTDKRDFPVHAAIRASTDSAECLKALVARGADVQKCNRDYETALTLAVRVGHYKQVAWLLHQAGIWDLKYKQLNFARVRLQEALPGQEPTHEQLIEERKTALWRELMRSSDLKSSEDRLPTMRVLRDCKIPLDPGILLQTLEAIHDRCCGQTELDEIKFLHKTILAQHPGFKLTAEHLENAPRYEMIPGIKEYVKKHMSQEEQNRYWDRAYADEDSNAEALSDVESSVSSDARASDYESALEEDDNAPENLE